MSTLVAPAPGKKTQRLAAPPAGKKAVAAPVVAPARSVSISKSKRSGLHMPVPRVARLLRAASGRRRVAVAAPIVLAGALQYVVAEVVHAAAAHVAAQGHKRLTPRHIMLALRNDAEFEQLTKQMTTAGPGVFLVVGGDDDDGAAPAVPAT